MWNKLSSFTILLQSRGLKYMDDNCQGTLFISQMFINLSFITRSILYHACHL